MRVVLPWIVGLSLVPSLPAMANGSALVKLLTAGTREASVIAGTAKTTKLGAACDVGADPLAKVSATIEAAAAQAAKLAEFESLALRIEETYGTPAGRDPLAVLNLGEGDDIHKKYRWLALSLHPDKLSGLTTTPTQVARIEEAYKAVQSAWSAVPSNRQFKQSNLDSYRRMQNTAETENAARILAEKAVRDAAATEAAAAEAAKAAKRKAAQAAKDLLAKARQGLIDAEVRIRELGTQMPAASEQFVNKLAVRQATQDEIDIIVKRLEERARVARRQPDSYRAVDVSTGSKYQTVQDQVAIAQQAHVDALADVEALEALVEKAVLEDVELQAAVDVLNQLNSSVRSTANVALNQAKGLRGMTAQRDALKHAQREISRMFAPPNPLQFGVSRVVETAKRQAADVKTASDHAVKRASSADHQQRTQFDLNARDFAKHPEDWAARVAAAEAFLAGQTTRLTGELEAWTERARRLGLAKNAPEALTMTSRGTFTPDYDSPGARARNWYRTEVLPQRLNRLAEDGKRLRNGDFRPRFSDDVWAAMHEDTKAAWEAFKRDASETLPEIKPVE